MRRHSHLLLRGTFRPRVSSSKLRLNFLLLSILCIFWLLIFFLYILYKPPRFVINYFRHKWPDVLWQVDTDQRVVALTIDDAPSRFTLDIMNLLNGHSTNATFFLIGGQITGRESILQSLVLNGHELANHAMHDEPSTSLTSTTLVEQINRVEEMITSVYASVNKPLPPRYFRPGSGFFTLEMRQILRRLNYRLVLGSIYPHDPLIHSSRINARHILSMLRPGAIIICHDRRNWTVPMLHKILPEIHSRGYQVVTLTRLIELASTPA